jgi:hypothetical protein
MLFNACKDDEKAAFPAALNYNYAPINTGHEIIYDVSLITRDEFTQEDDTAFYQVKELVQSVFTDLQGRPTQRLERYQRNTPNDPWVIADVWTSNLTSTHFEKKEDNITYVKLTFPINSSSSWNGNSLNTLDPQLYEYQGVHVPANVGGLSFDSTLTVLQFDQESFIDTIYQVERFATGVGMVFKEEKEIKVDYTNFPPTIKSQRLYTEVINSYVN